MKEATFTTPPLQNVPLAHSSNLSRILHEYGLA